MSSALRLAGDVFFHHLLTGRKRPLLASCKLTFRCNLRCQQCPFVDRPGADPTFAQVTALLDRLHARGDRVVIFEGGEPLLWRDGERAFQDIAAYARARFAVTGLTTNGTLPLDAPADLLWVSIDGFAETHNRLRGAPIFERVIENIRRSPHPRIYAHLTANAENHAELPALVRFLSPLVKGITLQFYYPYGEDDRLFLAWPKRRALLQSLLDLRREGYPILNSPAALRALMDNRWSCQPWRFDCADPDGRLWQGCYVQGRGVVDCARCGFSPYTEMSLAFQGHPQSILAGLRIFG
jgi:MoaA/NifB/PqqE/SkfB family radical SAM enzyme